jgi:hypothetical protein
MACTAALSFFQNATFICESTLHLISFLIKTAKRVQNRFQNTRVCVCVCVCTGCPRRNVPDFGKVFPLLKYVVITQNTYVQS